MDATPTNQGLRHRAVGNGKDELDAPSPSPSAADTSHRQGRYSSSLDTYWVPPPHPSEQKSTWYSSGLWIFGLVVEPIVTLLASFVAAVRHSTVSSQQLTPAQEEILERLKVECSEKFDIENEEHQEMLRQLWRVCYPGKELPGMKGPHWREMGWQGDSPSTDLRTAGLHSIRQLLTFGQTRPEAFERLLQKRDGQRSTWEYPFAVAGVNVTFMLVDALGILPVALGRSKADKFLPCAPFVRLLEADKGAFDALYAACFELLDREWLAAGASYMQFNEMMGKVRARVEQAMSERPEPASAAEVRARLLQRA